MSPNINFVEDYIEELKSFYSVYHFLAEISDPAEDVEKGKPSLSSITSSLKAALGVYGTSVKDLSVEEELTPYTFKAVIHHMLDCIIDGESLNRPKEETLKEFKIKTQVENLMYGFLGIDKYVDLMNEIYGERVALRLKGKKI